ncbi:MAG: hypothetical protein QOG80_3287 [Pseudonocardiales bacterium]|nr:hypothetical protein [Pseudonocardiales bacterium]
MPSALHPVTAERIARHGFVTRPARSVVDAARLTTAIQAQDPQQSRFGLRSRATGFADAQVLTAIDARAVVRTWLMRATIHLVAADDVRWLTGALGPMFARRFGKRWLDIGLTPQVLARTGDALPDVLSGGPLTRREIVAELAARGVTFPMDDPQAANHVLVHATGLGMICRASDRGRDSTFVLLDDWLPHAARGPIGDDAVAELARRYFAAFSPATAADFTTWSGLASAKAIDLIRGELEPVDVDGRPGFTTREPPASVVPAGTVRLAAGFDNYLIGYRDRALLLADEHRAAVYVGGIIKPTVLLNGRIVAIWRLARAAKAATVQVTPLEALTRSTVRSIEAEVADIGRFIALDTRLSLAS